MTTKPIALVTGGAQGIGLACAEALAEDGYRIVLADINEEGVTAAAADLGGDTLGLACDMGDPAAVAAMFDKVESDVGPASVLEAAGVKIRHELPGVGENLQDHLHYRSRWEIEEPLTFFGRSAKDLAEALSNRICVLAGGREAWCKAGGAVESSPAVPPDSDRIDYLFFAHDRHSGNDQAARDYLAWEEEHGVTGESGKT